MFLVRLTIILLGFALGFSAPSYAQLAPTPQKAPRTPVKSTTLPSAKPPMLPASRLLAGKATIIDSEKLKLDGVEMHLFGVIPPQMSAPLGPQARAVLDALAEGDVTCEIKDRERNGPYLAVCKSEAGLDFGLELLRRGLAVAARSTLRSTSLTEPYLAAEQAAQLQRTGVWETKIPPAISAETINKANLEAEEAKKELERLIAEKKEAEKKAEALKSEIAAAPPSTADGIVLDEAALEKALTEQDIPRPAIKPLNIPPALTVSLDATDRSIQSYAVPDTVQEDFANAVKPQGLLSGFESWLERNQLFATGLVFLLSSFVIAGGFFLSSVRKSKDDLRALAAALRGELLAARSIAKARIAKWSEEQPVEGAGVAWPRIRIIVFQAHVGRLGHLGAELARQVASIYGQSSDFASYYSGGEQSGDLASKRQALQTLLDHIEEVLPRLEDVEHAGFVPRHEKARVKTPLLTRIPERQTIAPPTGDGGGTAAAIPAPKEKPLRNVDTKKEAAMRLAGIKAEIMKDDGFRSTPPLRRYAKAARAARKRSLMERLDSALGFAFGAVIGTKERLGFWLVGDQKHGRKDTSLPDYANLTEEDLEALAESYFNENDAPKRKRFG